MAVEKEYVAYVDEYGSVIIDYDNDNFEHSYPYTTKNLTELERGRSIGGPELVKIHARLQKAISARAAKKFELFMGCLGNGITVCNKAVMEGGDYKMVAHISPEGEVEWYVAPGYAPFEAVERIRREADLQRNKYEVWWQSLSPEKRYEIELDKMSPAELVEHIKKKQEGKTDGVH
ncbi:hypothetical protein [Clostridium sp. D33t1_170424_F3]|uniref:hypothetical protein n=1 Tax=Clostridium sp. D33t1_170424_F3 TaxID=2787099 RepID=UPI0018AA220D|nr:hypothetical protein [Clostridium sp. D33t1_170424_F3]